MKRVLDIVLLVLFSPFIMTLFFLTSLVIRLKIGSPVLFKQVRPGLNGRLFKMYKFRTMSNTIDSNGAFLPDSDRLDSFGKFLRSTSLDELPELWNVLKGDMSLVGPRPLLEEYLPLYSKKQFRRHEIKPGITGWAQVNGRNAIDWDEKFEFDVWYVDNQTIWLDMRILWLTVKKVFKRDGINQDGHVTMNKFKGSI